MTEKVCCSLSAHQDMASCLEALEATKQPSEAAPEDLAIAVPCLFTRLKHRIIRLRRRTHDDWPRFRDEVEANLKHVLSHMNTRWLVSVSDTYADYGTPVERRNAMCIALLAGWEKLALTERFLAGDTGSPGAAGSDGALTEPPPLWDGMTAMLTTRRANVLPNLFGRLGGLMAETPVLHRILTEVVRRMKVHPGSTLVCLDRRHERDLFDDIETALGRASPSTEPFVAQPSGGRDREEGAFEHATISGLKEGAGDTSAPLDNWYGEDRKLQGRIDQLTESVGILAQNMESFINKRFAHDSWVNEIRYRDILALLERITPLAPYLDVYVEAERPIAEQSPDHKFPHGTAKDNTRAPWFVTKCEQLCGKNLSVLDLGCSGGGMVLDFSLRGHKAIGLEGSDYSLKRGRAEWRTLGDRLFTCDITGRFRVIDRDAGERMQFDLITAWDVVEHLPEEGLAQFFDNIREHLKQDGMFVGTVSTRASRPCPDGSDYHATVRPKEWWVDTFRINGFELTERGPFSHEDFPRGNGVSPLYPADFSAEPDTGFHFAARRLDSVQRLPEPEGLVSGPTDVAEQARQAYAAGELERAAALFREALAQNPDHVEVLNDLGVVLGESGDPSGALTCFRRGLQRELGNPELRVNYVRLLRALGQDEEADAIAAATPSTLGDGSRQVSRQGELSQSPATADDTEQVYLHLENICGRARLEIEKVKNYLISNGYSITQDRSSAIRILLFGCAFNEYTEKESKRRLDEFLASQSPDQEIFVIEGLADTLGKQLVRDGIISADHVIRTGQYERLDKHFMRSVPYRDIPEANFVGQFGPAGDDPRNQCASGAERRFKKFSVQVGHGCNDSCSFCGDKVVVKNIRSKPLNDVLSEARRGIALGCSHIELIGDDVGAYGVDTGSNVIELLERICALPGDFSITMMELNTKYVAKYIDGFDRLFATGRFKSLAVAFQSGNDRILELMRRGYRRDDVLRVAGLLSRHGVRKHAHVLIGFPTETREEFGDSLSALMEGEFESASLFIYQDRRTASASRLAPKVEEDEKLARLEEAERYFRSFGYEIIRRADKLQVKRPADGIARPSGVHSSAPTPGGDQWWITSGRSA